MVEWLNDILLDGLVCLDNTESSGLIFLPFPDGCVRLDQHNHRLLIYQEDITSIGRHAMETYIQLARRDLSKRLQDKSIPVLINSI